MKMDYQDQVRFGYVEPDDDEPDPPVCPACETVLSHQPTDVYVQAEFPDDPEPIYECPTCHHRWAADEVYT
jgi:hypothetical protein